MKKPNFINKAIKPEVSKFLHVTKKIKATSQKEDKSIKMLIDPSIL